MKQQIERLINRIIATQGNPIYREPLIGYARADDPLFNDFRKVVGPNHFLPMDLLPDAQTVIAFFIPFQKQIIETNRRDGLASREWAEAYIATNKLISQICNELKSFFNLQGVLFESQLPTYAFDRELLISNWSHRHVAYACGLGSFGRNNLLITAKGSGGRFGSGVLNVALEPNPMAKPVHECLGTTKSCRYCETICPVNAFQPGHFDRNSCYRQCLLNDTMYPDLELCDVCGKCATGPCSFID